MQDLYIIRRLILDFEGSMAESEEQYISFHHANHMIIVIFVSDVPLNQTEKVLGLEDKSKSPVYYQCCMIKWILVCSKIFSDKKHSSVQTDRSFHTLCFFHKL